MVCVQGPFESAELLCGSISAVQCRCGGGPGTASALALAYAFAFAFAFALKSSFAFASAYLPYCMTSASCATSVAACLHACPACAVLCHLL